jgi:hypothetical protein
MAKLQSEFGSFHEKIKLKAFDENEGLREKRDLLVSELKEALKDEKVPGTEKKLTFSKFDQGSYAMNTGIKPINNDYDIDVGIVFDIMNHEYDSNDLKKLVYDKLNLQHNRTVEFNRPCVTVKYATGYHVDLAIYSENDDDLHIAWGKRNSQINRCWYKSEPKKLTKWVSDVSTEKEASAQFRKCVRYLKKWKEKHFSNLGNNAPPSIGITIQSRNAFYTYGYRKDEDLNVLINIAKQIKSSFQNKYDENNELKKNISIALPVEPYKDVYYKITLSQLDDFYNKIEALLEALEAAYAEDSEHEASKILRKVFGKDFPLVEDSKQSKTKPVVVTGNNA